MAVLPAKLTPACETKIRPSDVQTVPLTWAAAKFIE
jgi:hypothetical protein